MSFLGNVFGLFNDKKSYKDAIGESTWLLLHALADHFPLSNGSKEAEQKEEVYRQSMMDLLCSLSRIYPCEDCRKHMQNYFELHPPRLDNRAHAVRWMYNFHNDVNSRLGKRRLSPTEYAQRLLGKYSDVGVDGICLKCSAV